MTYQAKNNAYSTLAGSLTNVATSLTVQTGHGDRFPIIIAPDYTIITLEDASGNREVLKVSARAGAADIMTIVRAQEGTTARAWAAGDSVELRMTAGQVQDMFNHIGDEVGAHSANNITNVPSGNLAATDVQGALNELQTNIDTREKSINAATAKVTPVDADLLGVVDSADTNILKKVTWANIKATLKTYFDTLYAAASLSTTVTDHISDTSAAHAASAISYSGNTNLAATDVEAALDELDNEKAALSDLTGKIQPITASVGANALTITLNPTILDFRDATLTSGNVNKRSVAAAISVVVSSGSSLGTINAIQNRLAVLAIDNAGTVELAVVNLAGGVNLDETGVISTTAEGGAGAADSATVIYSTTARTNVPYRVVGFVESTQATAGTWATAPSKIQGYGGQAFAAMSSAGYGQTWQNLTGSRAFSTTYYNTTGKPIDIQVSAILPNTGSAITLTIGGVEAGYAQGAVAAGVKYALNGRVPPNVAYSVSVSGSPTLSVWSELR